MNSFISGSHAYDFHINLVNPSGQTGLQVVVEGAQMKQQGIKTNLGGNAQIQASFDLSISPTSGLKMSTPPLIIGQPVADGDAAGVTLRVTATGRTSTDTSVYNADGFKYEWYKDGSIIGSSNAPTHTTSTAGEYYVVVSNELGSATSNNSVVS